MPYCTIPKLKTRIPEETLIQLTDDEGAGIINETRINEIGIGVDGWIDSYLGKVTTVPLTTVPAIIEDHAITGRIYRLYRRRTVIPESIQKDYDKAENHLKDIAKGLAALPPTTEADYVDDIQASHTEEDKKFTMGKTSDGSSGTMDNY